MTSLVSSHSSSISPTSTTSLSGPFFNIVSHSLPYFCFGFGGFLISSDISNSFSAASFGFRDITPKIRLTVMNKHHVIINAINTVLSTPGKYCSYSSSSSFIDQVSFLTTIHFVVVGSGVVVGFSVVVVGSSVVVVTPV